MSKENLQTAFNAKEKISYAADSIVSRELIHTNVGNVTLFAFDAGQALSEHTAPFDALVYVLEGSVEITISGKKHHVAAGEMIIMPAGVPHAVLAEERFKMMLTMIRG